jgi:hypothetical protein
VRKSPQLLTPKSFEVFQVDLEVSFSLDLAKFPKICKCVVVQPHLRLFVALALCQGSTNWVYV